jgi:polysaccharide deacetylase family protein (PEP-CTERM system associated)
MPSIANALSIDVEDYFHVAALAPYIARSDWEHLPCRVEANIETILGLLAEAQAQATFFVLGWVAERYPALVRRIAAAGHEIASHGYDHERATHQGRGDFYQDICRAKRLLEEITGVEVGGYRAPSFSIDESSFWAFDCIAEAGYRYSSSVYPIHHDHYGMPDAPRFPFRPIPELLEIPVSTARVLTVNLPAGGGGYFRLLPYAVSRALIRRVNETEGRPAVFYLHPWELDAQQPRIPGTSLKARFRHYLNLERMQPRLRRLLHDFAWRRMDRTFLDAAS